MTAADERDHRTDIAPMSPAAMLEHHLLGLAGQMIEAIRLAAPQLIPAHAVLLHKGVGAPHDPATCLLELFADGARISLVAYRAGIPVTLFEYQSLVPIARRVGFGEAP